MEVEVVGREESVQLDKEREEDGGKKVAVSVSGPPKLECEEAASLQQLEEAVKNLRMDGDGAADADPGKKAERLRKLEEARARATAKMRQERRMIWREKAQKEVRERAQFQDEMVFMLPEEWEAILGQVKDGKDKRVLGDISLHWRDEMRRERTRYLFHEVFSILYENNDNANLTRADMQSMRSACQEWKETMDHALQNRLQFPVFTQKGFLFRNRFHGPPEKVAQFREWTALAYTAGENPFPSRKLLVGNPSMVNEGTPWQLNGEFWGEVEQLLREWGGEVWELTLLLDPGLDFNTLCVTLQRFLGLVPNLRHLFILCRDPAQSDYISVEDDARKKGEAGGYLPDLPHLKVLDLNIIPPPVSHAMLERYGATLETVIIQNRLVRPYEYAGGGVLPHLKTFSVIAGSPIVRLVTTPTDLPLLEEISLNYHRLEGSQIPVIFNSLNEFGGSTTLRSVDLDLCKEVGLMGRLDETQLKTLSLDLPQVEKFTLAVCRLTLKGIDFILPMAALRELSVTYVKYVNSFEREKTPRKEKFKDVSGEIIKFGNYISRLYESNIWTVFPLLGKVTIRIVYKLAFRNRWQRGGFHFVYDGNLKPETKEKQKIYTREGYEQHLAKG